jgi:hypothetical protein
VRIEEDEAGLEHRSVRVEEDEAVLEHRSVRVEDDVEEVVPVVEQ